ncbi:hypothetical protein GCM10007079_17130 [Nocardiopsis terrae]|uniref:DUF4352 domain-containing protein n=1 Tax=Nocardiopsis terrae TaxID=372655 RepID=A0ABR9HI15_9ACTN|nr:hypothetical protein [Nocardiopsis terrae]MBE1458661.1 hypothetical protein [Nocardiopsis terrae]GHC79189.1 hypothetical protein GCM10007079_17130 [Nocardiopsis terrae]
MNKTGWIATATAAVVALLIGFTAGWFGNQAYIRTQFESAFEDIEADFDEDMEEYEAEEAPTTPAAPPSGEPTDGVFTYEVTDSRTSDTYNDEPCGERYTATGEYHVLTISAENVGTSPAYPPTDSWTGVYAYAPNGTEYSLEGDICSFSDETNPGNTSEYEVVFDVPEGTELAVLSLTAEEAPEMAVVEIP